MALFFPKLAKRDWKIFLFTNMATQVFLYVILFALPTSLLPASAIAAEVVIAVSEAMIFRKWMQPIGCAKRSRLVIAAVVANIMSAAAGIVSMFL